MTNQRITDLGIAIHHGHGMGDYSVALDMPAALTKARAANGAHDPIRAYITIVGKGTGIPKGIYISYAGDEIDGHVAYDPSKGDYAALCYALAVIRKRNAAWVASCKVGA